jgi:hypothetical protein
MPMHTNSGPPIVIGVVVLATIAAGIWAVGGPATGKQEKRDKVRLSDISKLNGHVYCLANAADKSLPQALPAEGDAVEECGAMPRITDPFTDQPYSYTRISDGAFRLCAGFEHPELIAYSDNLDDETGCITYQYTP